MTYEGRLRDSALLLAGGVPARSAFGRVAQARAALMHLSAGLPTLLPGLLATTAAPFTCAPVP